MKKLLLVSIFLCAICLNVNIFAIEDKWAVLESSIYTDLPISLSAKKDSEPNSILLGGALDLSKVAQLYATDLNLSKKSDYNTFISKLSEGANIAELCSPVNLYFSTVSGPLDPIPGTVVFQVDDNNLTIQQVFEEDQGAIYQPALSSSLTAQLTDVELDLSNSSLKYLSITGYMTGILVTDGNTEYVWAKSSVKNCLPLETLLSSQEILDNISQNEDKIILATASNGNSKKHNPKID